MEFGLGHINSTVVAVGGISTRKTKKQRCNELYILSHRSKWVTTLPPMPTARSLATVLSIESGLIVAGGQTDTELNTVAIEVFKRESAQWYKCEQVSLPTACYNLSLTTSGDNLYITGGFGNQSLPLNQALSTSVSFLLNFAEWDVPYGTIKTQWKPLLDTPAYQPVVAMLDGNLLAIGGWETPETKTIQAQRVHVFCPSKNAWVYISDLPKPLVWSVSASLQSSREILIIGGNDTGKAKAVYKGSLTLQI